VKEGTTNSRGLWGDTYIDSQFVEFLKGRIGPFFKNAFEAPIVYGQLMKPWKFIKSNFDYNQSCTTLSSWR
jgi:hypothetical protein